MHGIRACHSEIQRTRIALFLSFLLSCSVSAQDRDRQRPAEPAEALLHRVVANEVKAEQQDKSHWSLRLETWKPNGQEELDEVVETKDADLSRPLTINGHDLTPEQRHNSDLQIQEQVRNPGELQKLRNAENQDAARSQRLLKMLPDAFHFDYGERRGNLVQLNFSPKPSFHPRSREAEVFHAMKGSVWVDSKQQRVEEIAGRLTREVKFGGGLLGHLNQGGTFDIKQAEVAPGYWELTVLNVQMKGKALFFKTIAVQQHYARSDFRKVPDNLTLAQAGEILRKQSTDTNKQAQTVH